MLPAVENILKVTVAEETERLERKLSFLATTANTAPFIGLFGTVWGIIDSFREIGLRGTTSLAVVAPGISEALITTALGLATAIPAVLFYNTIQQQATGDYLKNGECLRLHNQSHQPMNSPRSSKGPLSEINIVPLVDVMLVLLIIFMITAPMMQQGLPIDLPKVTAKPLPSKEEVQIMSITKDRRICSIQRSST